MGRYKGFTFLDFALLLGVVMMLLTAIITALNSKNGKIVKVHISTEGLIGETKVKVVAHGNDSDEHNILLGDEEVSAFSLNCTEDSSGQTQSNR